jgi:serine/threonine-protein kinase
VYLLGATLHAVLTGRPRHDGTELRAVLTSAYQSNPCTYPPSVPEELAELCNRATARDPDKRPSSALEFHRALTSFVAHTGSLALADAANERLTELESVLAEAAHDDARAARLATECRFGYLMALRDWPENPRAKLGLRSALEHVLAMEIARENAPAARAALAELKETVSRDSSESEQIPARLLEGVQRVEASFANRMRDREELAKVHHDQDVTVSARQRNLLLTAITGLIILSTASFALRRGLYAESIDPAVSITAFAALTLLLSVAGVLFGRRWLLKNAVNRQFASTLIISLVLLVIHRGLGLMAGADISSTLRSDMFIAVLSAAILGAHGTRAWFVPASVMLIAAIASGLYPPQTHVIWAAASIAFFFSVAMVWRRAAATPGPV